MHLAQKTIIGILAHLFVKVPWPWPGDGEGTIAVFESSWHLLLYRSNH